jgi:glycosyltransferase involved in cell wall biosynthesis
VPSADSLTIAMVAACPFPAPRGTPIRILRLAEGLAGRGHRVHVVTYHFGVGEVDSRVAVHRIPAVSRYRRFSPGPTLHKLALLDPMLAGTLFGLLRRERVDIIHAHHFEGLLVAAAARAGRRIPLVFDVHTLLASELPTYELRLPLGAKRFIGARADRWLPGWANHVASCSERIRARLIELAAVPEDRVTVVPNGVELDLFDPAAVERGPTTRTPPRLVFSGNLARYQGIEFMLVALRKVLSQRDDVRLTLVTGDPFDDYEARARELGVRQAIDLVPASLEQVPQLLARADVALNPRIDSDGMPLKLLNYMAAGRPVVSFAGSAPGLAHGKTAWLARDGDADGFAEGVLALLADRPLADALGRNARRFVQANHSWARSVDRTEEIYAGLLASPTRPGRAGAPVR